MGKQLLAYTILPPFAPEFEIFQKNNFSVIFYGLHPKIKKKTSTCHGNKLVETKSYINSIQKIALVNNCLSLLFKSIMHINKYQKD